MVVIIIKAAFIVLLISLARDVAYSTNAKDTFKYDNDSDMLRELLRRMDKMQSHMDELLANDLNMRNNVKNLSVVMETIVEQQMVITAEIFTVSQTLPFCCCQYQNSTDPPEIATTTTDPTKPEITTSKPVKLLTTGCAEATEDGVYQLNVTKYNIEKPFDVYCMNKVAKSLEENVINGRWLLIHRRQNNLIDFYRNWIWYQKGFGDINGNYWIGLDKLYAITSSSEQELWIQLEDYDGVTRWAKYGYFEIGAEYEKYKLKSLGTFYGTANDSLSPYKNQKWSTFDNDNDAVHLHCAELLKGAWWFQSCGIDTVHSSLNGIYGKSNNRTGILWFKFRGRESLKYAHMAIRPRN